MALRVLPSSAPRARQRHFRGIDVDQIGAAARRRKQARWRANEKKAWRNMALVARGARVNIAPRRRVSRRACASKHRRGVSAASRRMLLALSARGARRALAQQQRQQRHQWRKAKRQ
jgi:hypothetical protein